jgi:hypothetical protein
VSGLDAMIRELIRDEIRRLIRPDAIAANDEMLSPDDRDLHRQAQEAAARLRRARRA